MAPGTKRNGKIDEQIEESFPASDPPSFMGGEVLGAPPRRKSTHIKHGKPAKKKAKAAATKKRPAKKPTAKKKTKARKRATNKRKSR